MRGRLGVADQHHVVGDPAVATNGREIAPDRAVGDQPMSLQLLREQAFGEMRGRGFIELVEAGACEGFWIGLDNPGRALRFVLVAMVDEDAVLGLPKEEREGIERPGRAHPGEKIGPQIHVRSEPLGKSIAPAGIDAVGDHDEIGIADGGIERRDFALVLDLDAERARAPAENLQQRRARAAAEPVAADAVCGAAEMDLDIVPIGKVADDRPIALLIMDLEGVERLVREHDSEAEGIVRPVALEDGDAGLRPGLLQEDREIEARRAAADHVNLHARLQGCGPSPVIRGLDPRIHLVREKMGWPGQPGHDAREPHHNYFKPKASTSQA